MIDLLQFQQLDSTNDEIMRRAQDGAPDGLWVMTDVQIKGRGRQGRIWDSQAPGNLICSRLVRLHPDEVSAPQLSFVTALAVHETLSRYAPSIRLKWPNDVMANERKLAGILLEGGGAGRWLVIGIGINLAWHPTGTDRPALDMRTLAGISLQPRAVLEDIADAFDRWRRRWRDGGFAPVRTAWLAAAQGLGERVVARVGTEAVEGVFAGLGTEGALQMRLDSGEMRDIHAGEVFGIV